MSTKSACVHAADDDLDLVRNAGSVFCSRNSIRMVCSHSGVVSVFGPLAFVRGRQDAVIFDQPLHLVSYCTVRAGPNQPTNCRDSGATRLAHEGTTACCLFPRSLGAYLPPALHYP